MKVTMKALRHTLAHPAGVFVLSLSCIAFAHADYPPNPFQNHCNNIDGASPLGFPPMLPIGRDAMPPPANFLPPFLHGIELTEEQQDKLFKIEYDQAPVLREKIKILHKTAESLHQLTLDKQFDNAKAKTLAETFGKTTSELFLLRTETDVKIMALLTEEQRNQIAKNKDSMIELPMMPFPPQ